MVDLSDIEEPEPFFQTTEGRRVLIFSGLLIVVVIIGGISYLGQAGFFDEEQSESEQEQVTSREELQNLDEKWSHLLEEAPEATRFRATETYREILTDLARVDRTQFAAAYPPVQVSGRAGAEELIASEADVRGNVHTFGGTVVSMRERIQEELVGGTMQPVTHLAIREEGTGVLYEVHVLDTPPQTIIPGQTHVEGIGVFLLNKGSGTFRGGPNYDRIQAENRLLFLAPRLETIHTPQQEDGSDEGEETGEEGSEDQTLEDLPPAENFENREIAEMRWRRMLSSLNDWDPLPLDSDIFHKIIQEVETVGEEKLSEWSHADLGYEDLGKGAMGHRGKVVPFQGRIIKGDSLNMHGGPEGRDQIHRYFLLFDNNKVYRVRTLEEPDFPAEPWTRVKGVGVYLHSPTHRLQNPPPDAESDRVRAHLLLAARIEPNFLEDTGGAADEISMFYIALGVLFLVFLMIFIYVVFSTHQQDTEAPLRRYRKRKEESEENRE